MQINALIDKNLSTIKVGGIAIGAVLGFVITASIVRNNILSAKMMKGNILKLKSEGFIIDTWLDNAFEKIETAAGFSPKQQAAKKPVPDNTGANTTSPSTSSSADGGIAEFVGADGLQSWGDPDLWRRKDIVWTPGMVGLLKRG